MRGPDGVPVGELRRVIISNIVAYNVNDAILMSGVTGHSINDIELKNIKLYFNSNGTAEQANHNIPEMEKGYPEPGSFGTLPAYGIYARHMNGLKLEDIDLNLINTDQRPAIMMDDVNSADIRFTKAPVNTNSSSLVQKSSTGITLFQSLNSPDSGPNK